MKSKAIFMWRGIFNYFSTASFNKKLKNPQSRFVLKNLPTLLYWHALNRCLFLLGICGAIAVIIFGAYGDARFWMPNWEHNNMGWSYWFAVIGSVSSFIGGICFLVEARKHSIKHKKFRQASSDYNMDERRTYS